MTVEQLNKRNQAAPDRKSALARSAATGAERLRELEQLLKTADEVQRQAEEELSQSHSSRAQSMDRKATAERIRRKAEAEIKALRAHLAREEARSKRIWTPGDPIPEQNTRRDSQRGNADSFEISLLTGSSSSRFSDSAFQDSDLAISEEITPHSRENRTTAAATARRQTAARKRSSTKVRKPRHHKARKSSLIPATLMIIGILTGAAATYIAIQDKPILQQLGVFTNAIQQRLPSSETQPRPQPQPPVSEQPAAPAGSVTPPVNLAPAPRKTEPAPQTTVAVKQTGTVAAADQKLAAQLREQQLRDQAALRLRDRLAPQ